MKNEELRKKTGFRPFLFFCMVFSRRVINYVRLLPYDFARIAGHKKICTRRAKKLFGDIYFEVAVNFGNFEIEGSWLYLAAAGRKREGKCVFPRFYRL